MILSIVIPVYNEAENLKQLYQELSQVLEDSKLYFTGSCGVNFDYEIIMVDDGSTDNTEEILRQLDKEDESHFKPAYLRVHQGKTEALRYGFAWANGDFIIQMDGDLQDDPFFILPMIKRLVNTHPRPDMVNGWRVNRFATDPLSKSIPSRLYNWVLRKATGIDLHDFNCGMKLYSVEVVKVMTIYGDMHRLIPVLVNKIGFRIAELEITQRPRTNGQSKFGSERLMKGLLDFLMVLFITSYAFQPFRFFGPVGLASIALGVLGNSYLAVIWALQLGAVGTRPLLSASILAIALGVQLIAIGLIGEMVLYHKHREF